jgi:hypothetical protein
MQPLEPPHCQEYPAHPLTEPPSRPVPDYIKVNKNGYTATDIPVIYNACYLHMDLAYCKNVWEDNIWFYEKTNL